MNILMMTNTFTPHTGGVARSVEAFTAAYRRRGHRVLVVAPEFEDGPDDEHGVVRVPAIENFNGSDFSVILPIPGYLHTAVQAFDPHVIHAHHPFLLGGTALRAAEMWRRPLVFTHHTMYERYTHYVPGDSKAMRRFVVDLSTSYANLCDQVFAPSESTAAVLRERGVESPVLSIPTGVDLRRFRRGDGGGFRAALDIPADAFVVGHVGRLAPEKNLPFLAEAIAALVAGEPRARALVVGSGPAESVIREAFEGCGAADRLHPVGVLESTLLVSAYRAMDVFAFASKSETQGMVLTEAAAAGVPLVALDAPGARDVVEDGVNGRLLDDERVEPFVDALRWVLARPTDERRRLGEGALRTAEAFSMDRSADAALGAYERLLDGEYADRQRARDTFAGLLRVIKAEWDMLKGAAGAALGSGDPAAADPP